jgi:hypothetical protein
VFCDVLGPAIWQHHGRVLLRSREVPVSNLGPETGYPDGGFSWCTSVRPPNAGIVHLNLATTAFFHILYNSSSPIIFSFDSISSVLLRLRWSRVSSISIVSDYGLHDRAIAVRSPAGEKDFSSNLCVQTGSGAHPAYCTMGTGGPFPGGKSAAGT